MDLLKYCIKEVYNVETVKMEGGWSYVIVDMMVNCYGLGQRVQHPFNNIEEWVKAKEQGYYLA